MTAIESKVLLMSTCCSGSVLNTRVMPFCFDTITTVQSRTSDWMRIHSLPCSICYQHMSGAEILNVMVKRKEFTNEGNE